MKNIYAEMKVDEQLELKIKKLHEFGLNNLQISKRISEQLGVAFSHKRVGTVLKEKKRKQYKPKAVDREKWEECRREIVDTYRKKKGIRTSAVIEAAKATHGLIVSFSPHFHLGDRECGRSSYRNFPGAEKRHRQSEERRGIGHSPL